MTPPPFTIIYADTFRTRRIVHLFATLFHSSTLLYSTLHSLIHSVSLPPSLLPSLPTSLSSSLLPSYPPSLSLSLSQSVSQSVTHSHTHSFSQIKKYKHKHKDTCTHVRFNKKHTPVLFSSIVLHRDSQAAFGRIGDRRSTQARLHGPVRKNGEVEFVN